AISVEESDIVMSRMHGMSPMNDTGVDPVLRNLGVTTIVLTGVSLNVAIPNITMDAVNRGYYVVIPRDAVAGVPAECGEARRRTTRAMLAFLPPTDELISLWSCLATPPAGRCPRSSGRSRRRRSPPAR